jgi:anthranilate phosphoribosyltransferase
MSRALTHINTQASRLKKCISQLSEGGEVSPDGVAGAIAEIMEARWLAAFGGPAVPHAHGRQRAQGTATPVQTAAFLTALTLDRLTPAIVAACAEAMRAHALRFPESTAAGGGALTVDIVGTGGDGIDTFNVSTAASIVVAAAGLRVLKHGNRSNSSKCGRSVSAVAARRPPDVRPRGSADVLEAMGARIDLDGPQCARVAEQCGFCFLFAQRFHPAMRQVAPVRKQVPRRSHCVSRRAVAGMHWTCWHQVLCH